MTREEIEQKQEKRCKWCKIVFFITLAVSIGLIVGGFFVPPTGQIDGSVLKAVGELLIFPTLAVGYKAIELGYDLKMAKGDASIEINNK